MRNGSGVSEEFKNSQRKERTRRTAYATSGWNNNLGLSITYNRNFVFWE